MKKIIQSILVLIFLLSYNAFSQQHYVTVFDSHLEIDPQNETHSFAVFFKINPETNEILETQTISWLPENLDVEVFDFVNSKRGKNFSLKETLEWTAGNKRKILVERTHFIPIDQKLYDLAREMTKKLNNQEYLYKVINVISRGILRRNILNCLQALGAIDSDISWNYFTTKRGQNATLLWLKSYRRYFLPYPYIPIGLENSLLRNLVDQNDVLLNDVKIIPLSLYHQYLQ